ncbi:MAG TPA: hypothetical protein PLG17_06275 [Thermodesulfobacteriota bacterium]|nr:hypothetical protein [Thermodesulfobacteriota bacterium]
MRNFNCSKYDFCLSQAAANDLDELACGTCTERDTPNPGKIPEGKPMLKLLEAVFPPDHHDRDMQLPLDTLKQIL